MTKINKILITVILICIFIVEINSTRRKKYGSSSSSGNYGRRPNRDYSDGDFDQGRSSFGGTARTGGFRPFLKNIFSGFYAKDEKISAGKKGKGSQFIAYSD